MLFVSVGNLYRMPRPSFDKIFVGEASVKSVMLLRRDLGRSIKTSKRVLLSLFISILKVFIVVLCQVKSELLQEMNYRRT